MFAGIPFVERFVEVGATEECLYGGEVGERELVICCGAARAGKALYGGLLLEVLVDGVAYRGGVVAVDVVGREVVGEVGADVGAAAHDGLHVAVSLHSGRVA